MWLLLAYRNWISEFLKFDVYIYGTIQFCGVRYLGFSKVWNIFEQFQVGYLELFFLSIRSKYPNISVTNANIQNSWTSIKDKKSSLVCPMRE